jgi:hypothetical protein
MTFREPVATPVVLGTVFPLLAIAAVLARFWARRKKRMAWRQDDWMLLPALVYPPKSARRMITNFAKGLSVGNAIIMLVGRIESPSHEISFF